MDHREFNAALEAGRAAAYSRFNSRGLRHWLDDAIDAAPGDPVVLRKVSRAISALKG